MDVPFGGVPAAPSVRRTGLAIAGAAGLLAAVPVALWLHAQALPLPAWVPFIVAALVFAVVAGSTMLLRPLLVRLEAIQLGICALAFALGWVIGGVAPTRQQAPAFKAVLAYSDGSIQQDVASSPMNADGRTVQGFGLHPAFGNARVANALTVDFPEKPKAVDILLSKPEEALSQDGKPRASDGISIRLQVVTGSGETREERFEVSQEQFVRERWTRRAVHADQGIARLWVEVGTGPPGSTPDYDWTTLALDKARPALDVGALGKRFLLAWALLCVGLYAALSVPEAQLRRGLRTGVGFARRALRTGLAFARRHDRALAAILLLGCLAYLASTRTTYVFFWDYRNYWAKTEVLFELLRAGAWQEFWRVVAESFSSDYSMLPALLPAAAGALVGYPTRLTYTLLITLLYAVPAYLVVSHLGSRLAGVEARPGGRSMWLIGFLCLLLGLPLFFGQVLFLMPDIGGVLLWGGALLSAHRLLDALGAQEQHGEAQAKLVRNSLGLALFLCLMFLFRRWYAFAAAGTVLAMGALAAADLGRQRARWRVLLPRAVAAFLLACFVALPLVGMVVVDWSRNLERHNYAVLYAGYKNVLAADFQALLQVFGIAGLAAGMAGAVIAYRIAADRRLWVLLVVSSLVACALFLRVQSPGRHHFYLMMPLLGASLFVLGTSVTRRFGALAGAGLLALLALGNIGATSQHAGVALLGKALFPSYADWLPKKQPHRAGYLEVIRWLEQPENKLPYCVIASSGTINESIFMELWQIAPGMDKAAFQRRVVSLGQVDSVNGPPVPRLRDCEIALVGVPFQTHLRPREQYSLEIVQQDLLAGSGIGAAYQRAHAGLDMGDGIQLVPFRRVRPLTDPEYDSLVRRFLEAKGPGYVNPAR